jgi:predicted Fe-Mo cluster-binding NifX family protein
MKIAVITQDGNTISQHFGRAPYYLVLTVTDGSVTARELREKLSHSHFEHHSHGETGHTSSHDDNPGSHIKHVSMAETISDCQVLICGGMGRGAYESMRLLHIQPLVTNVNDIDTAVREYLSGTLVDHTELLH